MTNYTQPVINPDDIVIPVMGITGSGKSTFISLCTEEKVDIGHGLMSCTGECLMYSLQRGGRTIRLIDTPGFDDSTRDDLDILTEIAYWLSQAYKRIQLAGIIYLHPVDAPRLGGVARRNLTMFKLLVGKDCLRSVVLATTMWDNVTPEEGSRRQNELATTDEFWGDMIKAGSRLEVHDNTEASALRIIDRIVSNRENMVLDIQRELVDDHKPLDATSAGQEQSRKFLAEKAKAESRLQKKQQELDDALRQRQQEDAEKIFLEQRSYAHQISEKQDKLAAMHIDLDELRRKKEAQWEHERAEIAKQRREVEAMARQVRQQLEAISQSREEDRQRTERLETALDGRSQKSSKDLTLRNADAVEHVNRIKEIQRNREELERARQDAMRKEAEALQLKSLLESMAVREERLMQAEMLKDQKRATRWSAAGTLAGVGSLAIAAVGMQCTVM
ncbi:uncharacterized protein AB675_2253 [Cyphellophora attinorum]|uniref:G domain-containing protein n=1 Tax=Cyphellophora attinorum TaxID=1664694 RepID=A0A0N1GXB1_9EURO|nr:uncharacterized protein AB675_2253 [Phialophora attinorum]KPI34877.1 hypothetical protein AB675_2253 [Phialophora attinorum]